MRGLLVCVVAIAGVVAGLVAAPVLGAAGRPTAQVLCVTAPWSDLLPPPPPNGHPLQVCLPVN